MGKVVVILIMMMCTVGGARGQWEQIRTYDITYSIQAIAVADNGFIYAGANDNLFLSKNSGNSWITINNGLTNKSIRCIEIIGSNVYVGTDGGGVFMSTNHGNSWISKSNGLTGKNVRCFAIKDTTLLIATNNGVFGSIDYAKNWKRLHTGMLSSNDLLSIAASGNNIITCTDRFYGVFKSTNNGSGWVSILNNVYAKSIKYVGNELFVCTRGNGMYSSSDNGNNWTKITKGLTNGSIICMANNEKFCFIGTNGGVFFIQKYSDKWNEINSGLTYKDIHSLTVKDDYLYAGTFGGAVFRLNIRDLFFSVSGKILLYGVPLINAELSNGSTTVTTDENGHFTFTDLVVGNHEITPIAVGYRFTPASISINLLADTAGLFFSAERIFNSVNENYNSSSISNIFPQPSENKLMISLSAAIGDEIKIYSIDGVQVYKEIIKSDISELELNTSNFQAGVYILELHSQTGVETKKIVIER